MTAILRVSAVTVRFGGVQALDDVSFEVAPGEFLEIVSRQESPLVVTAEGGFIGTTYQYLSSYKGLAFFTKSSEPLNLPSDAELVVATKIWIPN